MIIIQYYSYIIFNVFKQIPLFFSQSNFFYFNHKEPFCIKKTTFVCLPKKGVVNLESDKILCSSQREKHKMGPVSNSEEVLSAIQRGIAAEISSKIGKPYATYSFPKVGELSDLVCTNNRDEAVMHIQHGYKLFTVPQMFGAEDGQITLYLERAAQSHKASQMSKTDADRVLTDYETSSRERYSS